MSILSKVTVSASVLAAMAVVGTTKASADTVDTTSDTAITQEAKLVIRGIETDGKTSVPTGSARIVYLKNHDFDPNVVQQKVNALLGVNTSSSNTTNDTNTQSSAASSTASSAAPSAAPSAASSAVSSTAPSAASSSATPAPTASSVTASSTTTTTPSTTNTQSNQSTTKTAPVTTNSTATTSTSSALPQSDQSAKEWIAQRESSGSYTARNGRYVGRYQLDSSYLNGDYSAANQEKVATSYVTSRYGSWSNAKQFWISHGWY